MSKDKPIKDNPKHWLMFRCLMAGTFIVLDIFFIISAIEIFIAGNLIGIIAYIGCALFLGYYSKNIYYDIKQEFLTEKLK